MEEELSGTHFKLMWQDSFCTLLYDKQLCLAVCKADKEYIPIKDFKNTFREISANLDQFPVNHLVFDKRNLRTFDQPSMEWYFASWKAEVKTKGLVNHYKILPDLLWFRKAVEAGKSDIFQKYPPEIFSGISIKYVNGLPEVIELLKSK